MPFPPSIERLDGIARLVAIASRDERYKTTAPARRVAIRRFMRMLNCSEPRKLIGIIPQKWIDEFPD